MDEEYKDRYWGFNSKFVENRIKEKGIDLGNFTPEEIDLAGRYPFKIQKAYDNKELAEDMEKIIAEKYDLEIGDNLKSNAFKHTYMVALNKDMFDKKIAARFANAHENNPNYNDNTPYLEHNIYEATDMDLHNNAVGLSINRPKGMSDEEFAEYVYHIVSEDGYWISPDGEENIPDWAKMD